MFHVDSKGAISYAKFRHLGNPGVLGRYSLHFHLAGDSMRGASVIGATTRDSGNCSAAWCAVQPGVQCNLVCSATWCQAPSVGTLGVSQAPSVFLAECLG